MANIVSDVTVFEAVLDGNLDELYATHNQSKTAMYARDGRGYMAVHLAAEVGQSTVLQWLARNHYDLDVESATGYYPIHIACDRGNIDCVLALKMGGANLNVKTFADNVSPLHMAARNGDVAVVQFLMKHGADPRIRDRFGNSSLDMAVNNGRQEAAEFIAKEMKLKEVPKVKDIKHSDNAKRKMMSDEEIRRLRKAEYRKTQLAESKGTTFLDIIRSGK